MLRYSVSWPVTMTHRKEPHFQSFKIFTRINHRKILVSHRPRRQCITQQPDLRDGAQAPKIFRFDLCYILDLCQINMYRPDCLQKVSYHSTSRRLGRRVTTNASSNAGGPATDGSWRVSSTGSWGIVSTGSIFATSQPPPAPPMVRGKDRRTWMVLFSIRDMSSSLSMPNTSSWCSGIHCLPKQKQFQTCYIIDYQNNISRWLTTSKAQTSSFFSISVFAIHRWQRISILKTAWQQIF